MSAGVAEQVAARLWGDTGGDPVTLQALSIIGPGRVLPSVFDVTSFAAAGVACATLAVSELATARYGGALRPVTIDRRQSAAAFVSEALFAPLGWERPAPWDPIAGNYRTTDGWIRLHTNYRYHRAAVERVLGVADMRAAVEAAVARWSGADLEGAVVAAGGCAAVMHDRDTWTRSTPGEAASTEPVTRVESRQTVASLDPPAPHGRPLAGIRVLDLTRVIAGPVATRFLAAYGADVLRTRPGRCPHRPSTTEPATSLQRRLSLR